MVWLELLRVVYGRSLMWLSVYYIHSHGIFCSRKQSLTSLFRSEHSFVGWLLVTWTHMLLGIHLGAALHPSLLNWHLQRWWFGRLGWSIAAPEHSIGVFSVMKRNFFVDLPSATPIPSRVALSMVLRFVSSLGWTLTGMLSYPGIAAVLLYSWGPAVGWLLVLSLGLVWLLHDW